jgi:MoaA/NifB/PqqE/SkfB family radical SAM enzyme
MLVNIFKKHINNMIKKQRAKLGKKNSQLVIRINGEERDEFVSLCEDLDSSAARELRKFIRRFVDEHKTEN